MKSLMQELRAKSTLESAWKVVRASGLQSASNDIRAETIDFDNQVSSKLHSIQSKLAHGTFAFMPQTGVEKKRKNKSPRPLILAPIGNRIVQRALLDVLKKRVPAVRDVLTIKTSVGGIEGTDQAIAQVVNAMGNGKKNFIRSDIPGFFTNIPRSEILKFISDATLDEEITGLFDAAITTVLGNEALLGKQACIFPIGEIGVAQGSALSPLIGNILLRDFDREMNSDGIVCIRYIDDFIILATSKEGARLAFRRAKKILKQHGLEAYHPQENPDKASMGNFSRDSVDFLGYQIQAGLVTPSKAARKELLNKCKKILGEGLCLMKDAKVNGSLGKGGYSQTLRQLDRTIKGWGDAFAYRIGDQVFDDLDIKINKEIDAFNGAVKRLLKNSSPIEKRRIIGVTLLGDIKHKSLNERPRKLP